MTFNYAALAQTARRLLVRFGAAATLTRSTPGEYDPETASAPLTTTVQNVTACVFPVEDRYVDGSLIFATDQQAYIAAVGVTEPKPGDVLSWSGQGLTVVRTKNLGPSGLHVLYELQVRL